ncbi:tripartite tricarboxylate transporter substrate binding protein [Roseomonas terrae]|jgi:tripartite-type tricarboxylate transporter receptor subunit TctC|uniref:Tripartite tricarboxylate transporter substrate binding protein n=1 Tax=Neoroseomonas terrae TaxID=424799 RepID=A0ABS5EPB8_9PROT|nr:tripartite tricarboxylate transporter substrate binding protein [Neoroseomonas terrae]MBR0652861.1 tripartite tricarboxylate transporter substrate binding protein [Neoroseomonas terrae]
MSSTISRRSALTLPAVAVAAPAIAQPAWPSRAIRIVVPSAAGGYDTYARLMAPRLSELLGQPVVIDNRPGANGIIGMTEVQRSPADGHVLLFAHIGAISVNTAIYRNMPLDPVEDLAPISVAVASPLVWVVNPSSPFQDMSGLIARVQAEPDRWNYANPSSGSINHLLVEDFKLRHRLVMPGVPYRGTPQAQMDVVSGQVPIMVDSVGAGWGHISAGRVRALAVTGPERSERMPNVPTTVELGLDPQPVVAWYAYMAPKATPPEVLRRVNDAVNVVLREEATVGRFRELGAAPRLTSPDETLTFMRAEREKWGAVARAGNIVVE